MNTIKPKAVERSLHLGQLKDNLESLNNMEYYDKYFHFYCCSHNNFKYFFALLKNLPPQLPYYLLASISTWSPHLNRGVPHCSPAQWLSHPHLFLFGLPSLLMYQPSSPSWPVIRSQNPLMFLWVHVQRISIWKSPHLHFIQQYWCYDYLSQLICGSCERAPVAALSWSQSITKFYILSVFICYFNWIKEI